MNAADRQKLSGITLFLFDLDGTLVDTMRVWNRMTLTFLEKFGICATEQQIRAMDHLSFEEGSHHIRHEMGLPMTHEQFVAEWLVVAKDLYARKAEPVSGALEALRRLKARGARLALFSQSPRALVDEVLPRMGLWDCFDGIFLSGETKAVKGTPQAVLEVVRAMGGALSATAVVDDAPYAAQAARDAGVLSIGAGWMSGRPQELALAADLMLGSIEELA